MDGSDRAAVRPDDRSDPRLFLAEIAPPDEGWSRLQDLTRAARRGASAVRAEGGGVRFLRAMYLPEDDRCLFLFRGPDADAVREAGRAVGLAFGRVVEALGPQE